MHSYGRHQEHDHNYYTIDKDPSPTSCYAYIYANLLFPDHLRQRDQCLRSSVSLPSDRAKIETC